MDILITAADYNKLTQESKELLCAACEMTQLRSAKLINVRGKVSMNTLHSIFTHRYTRNAQDVVVWDKQRGFNKDFKEKLNI